jgi:hypothetical protein
VREAISSCRNGAEKLIVRLREAGVVLDQRARCKGITGDRSDPRGRDASLGKCAFLPTAQRFSSMKKVISAGPPTEYDGTEAVTALRI